jgi:hypothetical protein
LVTDTVTRQATRVFEQFGTRQEFLVDLSRARSKHTFALESLGELFD